MKRESLQALVDIAPEIGDIINEDISIAIMNSEKFIVATNGKTITTSSRAGDVNHYDEAALNVIKEGKTLSFEDLSGHFDYPVEVTFTPVKESDGTPTDVLIAVVKNIEQKKKADTASNAISHSFEMANKTISEIADGSQKLMENITDILKYAKETQHKLGEIDSLIKGIKKIALQSNILAINAGIEAVHAGNAGRGFSVIANEMGKLSKSSDEAAETANKALTDIKTSIQTISNKMTAIDGFSGHQAASTQEMSAAIQEIYNTVNCICN
jgi:archaellum component FlaC